MDEIYGGLHSTSGLMSPENMMISADYNYHNLISSSNDHHGYPFLGSDHDINVAPSKAASFTPEHDDDINDEAYTSIKAKISSHPCYPKLLDAYIDCQKVGAPPEIGCFLDEIRQQIKLQQRNAAKSRWYGEDVELDEFMETYCDILMKYKSDLSRPFHEATTFLNKIEAQLGNLCKDDSLLSDEEGNDVECEMNDLEMKSEDRQLKERLLREYGSHINTLKLEFSKKKKKGKLPKEARVALLQWWNVHYKWPYPTEADKISLAELTGLDQKQINNWFINQRKRHWKPSENMQLAVMDNLSGQFFGDD